MVQTSFVDCSELATLAAEYFAELEASEETDRIAAGIVAGIIDQASSEANN